MKKIKSCLISVFYKTNLDKIVALLKEQNVQIYATGGTYDFIKELDSTVKTIESLTSYPSILGGRVKTLHPKVFGGILGRLDNEKDVEEMKQYEIPAFDLVIVDLYPFEETVKTTDDPAKIIEKIDIGGISLIRAGAKNFKEAVIVPDSKYYLEFMELYKKQDGCTSLEDRKRFAKYAFATSSHYDGMIYDWFAKDSDSADLNIHISDRSELRYGENPHQKATFYGKLDEVFEKLHGKDLSYNNLLDLEAGLNLIREFSEPTFAILKHNNACGVASRPNLTDAWNDALAGDPVSAFGGVLVTNAVIDKQTAEKINEIFFEVIIAPDYDTDALEVLSQKKNRIILIQKETKLPTKQIRTVLNGVLMQDKDTKSETAEDMRTVTEKAPTDAEIQDMIFANKIVKHSKSNAIVLAKNGQLCASGVGQTSRVDALKQAIEKAHSFGFDLNGAVMASDAFFPFPDCVEIAKNAGITAVVQPGGSIKDQASVDYCNENGVAMVMTGFRHFKH